jgi:hypothetical protein
MKYIRGIDMARGEGRRFGPIWKGLCREEDFMQRWLCSICIFAIFVVIASLAPATVKGELSGALTFSLTLSPGEEGRESVPFDIDFETALQANLRLSGLIFTTDTVVGLAGLEHAILGFSTNLGDLSFHDEFWFAAPFDSGGARLGDPQFVKKRVTIKASGNGIAFENLVIFEDVHFSHPYQSPLQEPEYHFGNILTISGATSGGIEVASVTGICADPSKRNKVKKFARKGTVCESGELELTVERLTLKKMHIADLWIDQTLEFRPQEPFYAKTVLRGDLPLLDNAQFAASVVTTNVGQIDLTDVSLSLKNTMIYLKLLDKEGDLDFEKIKFQFALFFDAGFLKGTTLITQGTGVTSQKFVFGLSPPGFSFTNTTKLSGNGSLDFKSTKFALGISFNPLTLKSEMTYTSTGLSSAKLALILNF